MKLNTHALRYLTNEDWRVLQAVQNGSKNHEVVPTPLINRLSGLRGASGVDKAISTLAKVNLIAKVKNASYDGYRLTYGGLDYLALHAFMKHKTAYAVGNQIGVGKESDIYVLADESGTQRVLKIHRLGRISFRSVKNNRDYLRKRNHASWMYMSRLAAEREYAFMKILYDNGFPVPRPIDQACHCIIMELIDAFPLRHAEVTNPAKLYGELMAMILRFASVGLIHGDFNEFNILVIEETQVPMIIDFPQMISINHPNAKEQFDRDVQCIKTFFERKFRYTANESGPFWTDVKRVGTLDVDVDASGISKKQAKELHKYMAEVAAQEANDGDDNEEEEEEEEDDEEEDDEEENEEEQEDNAAHSGDEETIPKKK